MSLTNAKLNNIEAIGLLSLIMANKIILNLPELVISSTGSAAWINTIYIIVITFIFIAITFKLMKRFTGKDIIDISEYAGGPILKFMVSIIQIALLFFVSCTVIRSFSYTLKTIYFTQSPIVFIVILMIIPVIIATRHGIKSISNSCLYIIPIAYIGLVILLLAPIKDFEPQRIFPILGYGIDATFISGLSNLYALSGIGYVFLLPSVLDKNTNLKKITIFSLILSGVALFFSVLCMLFVFSFNINTNENMSLYLLTMVVHHGNVIHGINALFMIVWILSIVSYLSVTVFFIVLIIQKLLRIDSSTNSSKQIISFIIYIIAALQLVCSVWFQNNPIVYINTEKIMIPCILVFIFLIIPIVLLIANLKNYLNKISKSICSLLILITILFSFTGCFDATGIEELAYVVAIGLDLDDNNELVLSVQIATSDGNSSNSSSSDSSGSTSQSKSSNVTTIKCNTIDSGLSLINNHISKKLNLSHCQVVLISETLAKKGISPYLETLLNNSELRNDCSIIITKCDAKDYLNNVDPALENLTARFYESTLNSAKYSGYTIDITLFEFYSKMKDSCSQAYAILGNVLTNDVDSSTSFANGNYTAGNSPIADKDVIDNLGIAVFKDDKLVGELSGLDSICHILVNNQLKSCIISIPNPFDIDENLQKYIDLNLTSEKKTKAKVSIVHGTPHISIDVFLVAQGLTMNDSINYDDINQLNMLKSAASEYISTQINNYLLYTSKNLESDICGFGVYALKNYLTIQEWNAYNWLDNYKNSIFDVNVHLDIKSGNLFDKT
ncbi:MAG: Ger(x)C family spore germination protein [Clostridia bacterium]|nr:Ger(x)C family spore germination protein [Clostridia bacterium]